MPNRTITELTDLRGQVAIVTGGARGIGEGIGIRLAQSGATVYLADLNGELAETTAGSLRGQGHQVRALAVDVSDVSAVQGMVEIVVAATGRLDVLVNNAGIFPFSSALQTSEDLWDRVLDVNLKSAFFASQAAARQMAQQDRGGRIVNIASIDSLHPTGNLAHYDASKGGMLMLTRSLAVEFAPLGIRVNAIAPGGITTPGAQEINTSILATGISAEELTSAFMARIPLRRMGEPDDIAMAVLYFATPLSDYATGALLVVDGGYLLT